MRKSFDKTSKPWAVLAWCPVVFWYGSIYHFSAQTAEVSSGLSNAFLYRLLQHLISNFGSYSEETLRAAVEMLSFWVRKAAHMSLYFVLALLVTLALRFLLKQLSTLSICTFLFCGVLAAMDEYHQTFVAGRSGELRDIFVDLLGVSCAMVLFGLLYLVTKTRRNFKTHTGWGRIWRLFLLFLPVLLLMALIFLLSNQPSQDSDSLSHRVVYYAAKQFLPSFSDMSATRQARIVNSVNNIIRKLAHLSIFFSLGVLCMLTLALWGKRLFSSICLTLSVGFLYACSDEFHQLFTAGRGAQFSDVLIDTGGVLLGVCLSTVLWLGCLLYSHIRPFSAK